MSVEIKAYHESIRHPRKGAMGGETIPAGWSLCWVETGRCAESHTIRYATQEEAEARIPAILAARDARVLEAGLKKILDDAAKDDAIVAAAHETEAARGLATEKQIEYIVRLVIRRRRDGNGDGFILGEIDITDLPSLRKMTRREASALIDSLSGNY